MILPTPGMVLPAPSHSTRLTYRFGSVQFRLSSVQHSEPPRALPAPSLPQVPPQLYDALPLALAPVLGSPVGLLAAGLESPEVPEGAAAAPDSLQQQAARLVSTALNLLQQLPALAQLLPAETLGWKVQVLTQGCEAVAPLLSQVQQRTFILAAGSDALIPSEEEGRRLARALPRARLRVLPGRSHALLQEGERPWAQGWSGRMSCCCCCTGPGSSLANLLICPAGLMCPAGLIWPDVPCWPDLA